MFSKATAVAQSASARRLSAAAVLSVALLSAAACSTHSPATGAKTGINPGGAAQALNGQAVNDQGPVTAPPSPRVKPISYAAGLALISDGTALVKVGTQTVTFPTTVTGAAWSPDGSRIAFVDGQGNVATARPDGTNLIELTKTNPKVTRSHPTWTGTAVVFAEKSSSGLSTLESVATPASAGAATEQPAFPGADAQGRLITDNSGPSAQYAHSSALGSAGSEKIAYQHAGSDGSEVWIVDYASRDSTGWKELDGSDPALSPDGSKVAFVDRAGQIEVAATTGPQTSAAQVTFGASSPANLAWNQDGTRVAYSQAGGVYSVPATPAGHGSNPATQVSTTSGAVSFLPSTGADQFAQFAGTDPVALAIAASQDRWLTTAQYEQSQSSTVATFAYIGSSTDLATDLKLLPSYTDGPLLLTGGGTLDPRVTAELRRTLGTVADPQMRPTVYILGTTAQVSAAVEQAIDNLGYATQRVTAPTPAQPTTGTGIAFGTNRAISFVAVDQDNPLDELIGTAYASDYTAPVVQVGDGATLPTSAAAWIAQAGGSISTTAVFVPGQNNTTLANAIAAIEGSPLGEALVNNPAKPFGSL